MKHCHEIVFGVFYQGQWGSFVKIAPKRKGMKMIYMKELSVAFLLGLSLLMGLQSTSAQSITVQYNGVKQVGVPVLCTATGVELITDSLGEVKFYCPGG